MYYFQRQIKSKLFHGLVLHTQIHQNLLNSSLVPVDSNTRVSMASSLMLEWELMNLPTSTKLQILINTTSNLCKIHLLSNQHFLQLSLLNVWLQLKLMIKIQLISKNSQINLEVLKNMLFTDGPDGFRPQRREPGTICLELL